MGNVDVDSLADLALGSHSILQHFNVQPYFFLPQKLFYSKTEMTF